MQEAYSGDPSTAHVSKATPQYFFHKGMKLFGEEGQAARKKEIEENLLGMDAVNMVAPGNLNKKLYKDALPYIIFLKRKRTGKVKSRGVCDGSNMRSYISCDDTRSLTVSTYALMVSCCINTIENRRVYTCDVPGAFLQSVWPKKKYPTYLKFERVMVDLILEINPSLENKVIYNEKGNKKERKILYGEMNRAVYGATLSSLLFYQNLAMQLEKWGFDVNPYNLCTWNKMENRKLITIQFHVDDLKLLHVDEVVLKKCVKMLN